MNSILPVSEQVYSLKVTILGKCVLFKQQPLSSFKLVTVSKPKVLPWPIHIYIYLTQTLKMTTYQQFTLIINIYQRKNQSKNTYNIQM